MPENSRVVAGGKPVSTGTRKVAPNIATTCCAPMPMVRGQSSRSSGATTKSASACASTCFHVSGITMSILPGLAQFRGYQREWLRGDLLAGVTVAAYLVPQVMAYATVAGLPPVVGLWAALVPLAVYACARLVTPAVGRAGVDHRTDDGDGAWRRWRRATPAATPRWPPRWHCSSARSASSRAWCASAFWPTCCRGRCWSAT